MTRLPTIAQRRTRLGLAFLLYFATLWLLWPTPLVYPLKVFVVLLHEISHALAAVLTGGDVDRIVLDPYQGGAAYTRGGSPFLILSAGYLGSLLWGLAMLEAARARARRVTLAITALAAITLGAGLLLVRSIFGLVFALLFGAALLFAARRLPARAQAAVLTVLGLTSALYALLDIRSDILQSPDAESDALMLAGLTRVPAIVWGLIWSAIAVVAVAIEARRLFRSA